MPRHTRKLPPSASKSHGHAQCKQAPPGPSKVARATDNHNCIPTVVPLTGSSRAPPSRGESGAPSRTPPGGRCTNMWDAHMSRRRGSSFDKSIGEECRAVGFRLLGDFNIACGWCFCPVALETGLLKDGKAPQAPHLPEHPPSLLPPHCQCTERKHSLLCGRECSASAGRRSPGRSSVPCRGSRRGASHLQVRHTCRCVPRNKVAPFPLLCLRTSAPEGERQK